MKKLVSLALALIMIFSLAMVASAETITVGDKEYEVVTSITFDKKYTDLNPDADHKTSPAETFTFDIVATSVTDAAEGVTVDNMPVPTVGSVAFAQGEAGLTKQVTVDLSQCNYTSVGIYTYTITENAGTSAGVIYHPTPIKLVVTVLRTEGENNQDRLVYVAAVHTEGVPGEGEEKPPKNDEIENKYNSGDLSITKTVDGAMGDKSKYFEVKVTLNTEDGKTNYLTSYEVTGGSYKNNPTTIVPDVETRFWLHHGETITIHNAPHGMTYTVVESDYTGEGYDAPVYTFSDTNKKIDSAEDSVNILNKKDGEIDTGIILDSAPYILLLVVAFMGMGAMLTKKRHG